MSSRDRYRLYELCRPHVRALAATHERMVVAADDLDYCDRNIRIGPSEGPAFMLAVRAMQDARPALPGAQAYDSPSVSGGSTASQPERLAEREDRTEADRVLLDVTLRRLWFNVRPDGLTTQRSTVHGLIVADCLTLRRLIERWSPRTPTDKQRASVTRANDPEAECAHHRTFGTFEPVHRTTNGGGLLPHPMPLCRWCHDRLRTDGRLPSADRLQRLADGRGDRVRA